MAELPKPCPCGHSTVVNGEPWETDAPNGTCAEAAAKENDGKGRAAVAGLTTGVSCTCHDADGKLILKGGK